MQTFWFKLINIRNVSQLKTSMDTKHLSKGSKCPPLSKGKLRLYSMRFCPFAQRAHLVLDAKKIPYDIVNVHLVEKPEWFLERNPLGKVPALELESGNTIYESLIIAEYLDEKYPQRLLHSQDLEQKAKDRILLDLFNKVTSNIRGFYLKADLESYESLLLLLDTYEKELTLRSSIFYGGKLPGMLDYMMWPWFERMDIIDIMAGEEFAIPWNRYKKLNNWKNKMLEDEVVKISYIDPEMHINFVKSLLSGNPNYDLMAMSFTSQL